MLDQVAQHRVERSQPGEGPEDQTDHVLGLLVRIQDDLAGRAADVPDRQRDGQLAALGLGQLARQHPLPDQVQFVFAHRSLQAQQQPAVAGPRVVDAVGIGQQHPGQAAQLQQLVPVPASPRQPGHLDAQHDAHTCHRHLRDEPGKALPGIGRRGRDPQVVVDHHDLRPCPAQRHRPLGQRVLQPRRFGMLKHLLPGRLPDIHHRRPVQVLRTDLLLRLSVQPVPSQAHRDRLPPGQPRPGPPASPAARSPQPAVLAAAPARSGDRESPHSRRSAASGSPAAADRSRRTTIAACNSAPALSIAPGPGAMLETITASWASAVAD
jgi:hypothetical protein